MSTWAIVICTLLYFFVFVQNVRQGDYKHALMWFGYVLANCGLIWYECTKPIVSNL